VWVVLVIVYTPEALRSRSAFALCGRDAGAHIHADIGAHHNNHAALIELLAATLASTDISAHAVTHVGANFAAHATAIVEPSAHNHPNVTADIISNGCHIQLLRRRSFRSDCFRWHVRSLLERERECAAAHLLQQHE